MTPPSGAGSPEGRSPQPSDEEALRLRVFAARYTEDEHELYGKMGAAQKLIRLMDEKCAVEIREREGRSPAAAPSDPIDTFEAWIAEWDDADRRPALTESQRGGLAVWLVGKGASPYATIAAQSTMPHPTTGEPIPATLRQNITGTPGMLIRHIPPPIGKKRLAHPEQEDRTR